MKIDYKKQGDKLNISLKGELDHHVATFVKEGLDGVIEENFAKEVIFDFSQVTFMDSTGIGVLLGRYKVLKGKGADVFITNPNPTIDRLLKLSGIYSVIIKI